MMRKMLLLTLAPLAACSPISGDWTGSCSANGDWSVSLTNLTRTDVSMPGAEQPGEWASVRGQATITPVLGSLSTGSTTLWLCDEFYAPCMYAEDDGDLTEVDAHHIQGTISEGVGSEAILRFFGTLLPDDEEIEGSCYNLLDGGAGVINLTR